LSGSSTGWEQVRCEEERAGVMGYWGMNKKKNDNDNKLNLQK